METFHQNAQAQLRKLCAALGLTADQSRFETLLSWMFKGWGDLEIPGQVRFPSAIGDDHSPFEFSVAFGPNDVELRLLLEAQGEPPSLIANRDAALAFNRRLAPMGISLERFTKVHDLFMPNVPSSPFTLWHAVGMRAGRAADFKIYLNPQVRGPAEAWDTVTDALGRLGLGNVVPTLRKAVCRGSDVDLLAYFSLDLSDAPTSRVKVYFQHLHATAAEVERVFALAPTSQPGDVLSFCRAVAGSIGPFSRKAVSTCLSFVQGNDQPTAATFHLPIAHYVERDSETVTRVQSFMHSVGLSDAPYTRALSAFAPRALAAGAGVQSYASFRREPNGIRVTAYLSPELFRARATNVSHQRLKAAVPPSARKLTGSGSGSG